MKPGDLVRREGYSIFLYDSQELVMPTSIIMEEGLSIAIVLEVIPAKSSLRGKNLRPEKIRLLHPSGMSGWGYSAHYTCMT